MTPIIKVEFTPDELLILSASLAFTIAMQPENSTLITVGEKIANKIHLGIDAFEEEQKQPLN